MKKWEYRVEDNIEEKDLRDFLSKAGKEGWQLIKIRTTSTKEELVGGMWDKDKRYVSHLRTCFLIFKRELE